MEIFTQLFIWISLRFYLKIFCVQFSNFAVNHIILSIVLKRSEWFYPEWNETAETIAGKTGLKLSRRNITEINVTKNKALHLCKKQHCKVLYCNILSVKKHLDSYVHLVCMHLHLVWIKSLPHPTLILNCVFKDFLVAAGKEYPGTLEESVWFTCTCNITAWAHLGLETWILFNI